MAMTDSGSIRLRVEGPEELVVDLVPDDLPAPDRGAPPVTRLASRPADRAAGVRRYEVTVDGWLFRVTVTDGAREDLRARATRGATQRAHSSSATMRAQIPGRVVRLWVEPGASVEAGQRLLAIEAMKMENEVRAPRAGTIERVAVALGASVELGDELITVA
jgi:biotin carboxyl carrier protein